MPKRRAIPLDPISQGIVNVVPVAAGAAGGLHAVKNLIDTFLNPTKTQTAGENIQQRQREAQAAGHVQTTTVSGRNIRGVSGGGQVQMQRFGTPQFQRDQPAEKGFVPALFDRFRQFLKGGSGSETTFGHRSHGQGLGDFSNVARMGGFSHLGTGSQQVHVASRGDFGNIFDTGELGQTPIGLGPEDLTINRHVSGSDRVIDDIPRDPDTGTPLPPGMVQYTQVDTGSDTPTSGETSAQRQQRLHEQSVREREATRKREQTMIERLRGSRAH